MIDRPANIVPRALAFAATLTEVGRFVAAGRVMDAAHRYKEERTAENYDLIHNLLVKYGA